MPPEVPQKPAHAFTLTELISVIAIISLLALLLFPAFNSLRSARDLTSAAQQIANTFEQARTYAIANNTYVWLGIYEEGAFAKTPTNSTPPYPGRGKVILAMVASRDGTTACQDPNSSTINRIPLASGQIVQVGSLTKITNIHITDIGPPLGLLTADPNSIGGRPNYPYLFGSPTIDYQNRINSDDAHGPFNQTLYPFVTQGYTFYKTIRFSPRGEATINSTYALRRVAEIGIRSTHGTTVDADNGNTVAIQFSGISGRSKVYRK